MTLSAYQQATLHFYKWESLGRGYYHFDEIVTIEPPYRTFYHKRFNDVKYKDDGRVPSLFSQIRKLFSNNKLTEKEKDEKYIIKPNFPTAPRSLSGFSISFPYGEDISSVISTEFLNMLSFTSEPISFEIIGSFETITIQIVCSKEDNVRVHSHLRAYYPSIIIQEQDIYEIGFKRDKEVAIADFGLENEYMFPISISDSFEIDPLTSIIAILDSLKYGDCVIFQIIFQGVKYPWAKSIINSVTDGFGESFFSDCPETLPSATQKVSVPLFSAIIRIGTQGNSIDRSRYLAKELAQSITSISRSKHNHLIPLSNEGYEYDNHIRNIYNRTSNRLGIILNSYELTTFVHYPNKTVVSTKLDLRVVKTKLLPSETINQKYILGINNHNGTTNQVSLNDEARLRHTHIIGATGVGKSTLIANMMFEDINNGNGCTLIDPHGDIVEDILDRIPESRKNDVIVIDPADLEYAIGFNLLSATTEAEKIVLSSDLVSSFKRHASAWGDNMTAVLSNAINTFLESSKKGTLIELKRFLLEDNFRKEFLKTVDDKSIHYYWNYEYPMVKKGIAPLLTRIDTFLRPKIIRYMLAQTEGIDFSSCVEQKKIILIKLSQGLIGQENSYLLGSIFLSKFNQVAQRRQSIAKNKRHPYYLYLDEFQNFITPSIISILSSARKYGLGLILTHQELGQIDDSKTLNSVISNPNIRICFRLGDIDAKRLKGGFSSFEESDLQNLGIGEAIMRVGSNTNDFNIRTFPMPEHDVQNSMKIKEFIIQKTQKRYSKPISEIQSILDSLLPDLDIYNKESVITSLSQKTKTDFKPLQKSTENTQEEKLPSTSFVVQKQEFLKQTEEQEQVRKHRSLQNYVRALALQRDFKASIEESIDGGGRVDIGLIKGDMRIAVEISVTNSLDYEVQNIQKCIDAGYTYIYMISESMVHLKNIRRRGIETINKESLKSVKYFTPLELPSYLDSFSEIKIPNIKRVRGYRVKSNQMNISPSKADEKSSELRNIILKSVKAHKL
jgi:Type IV secretion-system coupling protein DNA-binding domain